jgi:hypothetical protein
MDEEGLCINVSYSIKDRNSNKQIYRANLFHTTGRIEVNGHGKDLFLEHLKEIIKLMESKGNCSQLNRLLEHQIREYMRKFPTGNFENKTSKKYVGRETDLTHAHSRVIMSVIKAQNEYRHDNAGGDASLADQNSRGEKDTSRDALLVPLQKQKGANVSGDASLADQISRGEKDTSRDALLVPSEQRESNAASGDASLVPLQKQK